MKSFKSMILSYMHEDKCQLNLYDYRSFGKGSKIYVYGEGPT